MHRLMSWLHHTFVPSESNDSRPGSLKRDFLLSIVAVVCVVEGFLMTSLMLQTRAPQFSAAVLEGALVSLTNTARAEAHLGSLTTNEELNAAAQAKANDMAAKGYFAHIDPTGKQAWDFMHEAGYDYAYAGENLAAHFYDSGEVVNAWLTSPSHRANIMKGEYRDIGIGIARGTYQGVDTIFVVQLFGATKAELGLVKTENTPAPANSTASAPAVQAVKTEPAAPSPIVAGESTTNIPSSIVRVLGTPQQSVLWVLGALLAVIIVSVVLAVFIRIRIQPVDLLLNGFVVASFVLFFIAANTYFFSGTDLGGSEAAAVTALSSN